MRLSALARRRKLQTVALELFSQQGYRGTTTRAIARRAGVSEALLFRHFPTKEDLYWSVLEEQCAVRGGRARLDVMLRAPGDDPAIFASIAEDILTRNFADSRLYRLLLFSALENHQLSHRFFRTYISDYYQAVAAHIRERVRDGRFRKVDPLLSARLFIGMALHYFLVQELFGGSQERDYDLKTVCRSVTDIWLAGIAAGPIEVKTNGARAHQHSKPPSKALALRRTQKAELVSR